MMSPVDLARAQGWAGKEGPRAHGRVRHSPGLHEIPKEDKLLLFTPVKSQSLRQWTEIPMCLQNLEYHKNARSRVVRATKDEMQRMSGNSLVRERSKFEISEVEIRGSADWSKKESVILTMAYE
jgi:hypothetical protein